MGKKSVRNSRILFIPLVSFFLLFLAIGILTYQLFKLPKEVKAVAGDIKFGAGTSGVGCAAGEIIMGGGTSTKVSCGTFESSFTAKTPSFAGLLVSGNVGIGTTAPTVKLDVVGGLNITGNTNICSLVAYTGGVASSCGSGYYTSSAVVGPASGHVLCCKVNNPINCTANGGACVSDTTCCSAVCGTNADGDNYFSLAAGHTGTCQANTFAYTDCDDANASLSTNTWVCDTCYNTCCASCCNSVGYCGGTCTGCASGPFAGCNPTNYDVWNAALTCYCSYCAIYYSCDPCVSCNPYSCNCRWECR